MDTITIEERLQKRLLEYQSTVCNIIEKPAFIVEVGALTVGTDENGKIIAQNVLYPEQFSKEAVQTILSMNWRDGNNNKIEPSVFFRNDWYSEKIQFIKKALASIELTDKC
ncbi:MAG: hypothetical protein IPH16_15980 [Haliscomenobacter sp.]|nr:hypothetical protein [Haliscomenobacter sp.]